MREKYSRLICININTFAENLSNSLFVLINCLVSGSNAGYGIQVLQGTLVPKYFQLLHFILRREPRNMKIIDF